MHVGKIARTTAVVVVLPPKRTASLERVLHVVEERRRESGIKTLYIRSRIQRRVDGKGSRSGESIMKGRRR